MVGKFSGGKFGEFTVFKHLVKKNWQRSAKRLLIVRTNLDSF